MLQSNYCGEDFLIPISKPHTGEAEKQAVLEVLDSGMLVQGPRVAKLETEFARVTGARHAVATNSGTTALHTALLAHGIGSGDEVITTPFTFIASVNSILYTGAEPKFVDVLPCCFNIDPGKIEAAITPKTKAILPVHLYGYPANMDAILSIAGAHGLDVIQDAAQAVGATHKGLKLGSFGTACYSLYATKNIHSAEGGIVTTNDDEIAERCRLIRAHGSARRYYHDTLGFNFRLSDLHAAIALPQLLRLDEINGARRHNAEYFNKHIRNSKVVLPHYLPTTCAASAKCGHEGHVWHQYTIRVLGGERDAALEQLTRAGVGTAVFYPVPAHHQKHLIDRGLGNISLPNAERLVDEVLSLPVHPDLSDNDRRVIVEAVNAL